MDYDVIIIGAGMAGLAAGIRLAMYDKRVVIVERHYQAGGLNSYYHRHRRPFDVGLHALTNYVPKGKKRAPLTKLLRQLRIPYDEFQLREQQGSEVRFPDVALQFTNEFARFRQSISEAFPAQVDGFDALVERIEAFDELSLDAKPIPSRPILEEHITDPLLIEMLYCPLMYYGSPDENAMEFGQFCIMFKSIFKEGFARPEGGVRTIIKALVAKYKALGGELRYQRGVKRILTQSGKVSGVVLHAAKGETKINKKATLDLEEEGEVLKAPKVLSTAGLPETYSLTDGLDGSEIEPGRLTFIESIMCLNVEPRELGIDKTIIFYNDSERFDYSASSDYADVRSGVICCTNNYEHETPLSEGLLRVTSIANYEKWNALEKPEPYAETKGIWLERQKEKLLTMLPEFRPHIVAEDIFTPTTIYHFTARMRGAIYGSTTKVRSGLTPIDGLFICGTDQGFLGIIGAMLSGISIANARVLMARS
jgi:phytoene dehydrogenase-like protein